jgi:hypothetical protein
LDKWTGQKFLARRKVFDGEQTVKYMGPYFENQSGRADLPVCPNQRRSNAALPSNCGRAGLPLCPFSPSARAARLNGIRARQPESQNNAALVLAGSLGRAATPPHRQIVFRVFRG